MSEHTTGQVQKMRRPASPGSGSGVLQRSCACGQHTSGGAECEACRKKREGMLQRSAIVQRDAVHPAYAPAGGMIQAKLAVNRPGDEYEQEAERVAEQVTAMPARHPITSAPPRIQRFTGQANGQMAAAPGSVPQALASSGRPLEPALRVDMEQRFGYDFSGVRVHSGAAAEQSARDVNAYAYTLGQDIVFGEGQFAPGTREGRRLLAHELTHVVQQQGVASGEIVRRLSPRDESFLIRGLPDDSDSQPNFVFFNIGDATIPGTELHKIADYVAAYPAATDIYLYGYASEEGMEAENSDLISDRLESVRSELARSFGGTIHVIRRPTAGILQINYRRFRTVEISLGASTIGLASTNTRTVNCETGQNDVIDANRTAAVAKIDTAISGLDAFRTDPTGNTEVQHDLDNNFHSHSSATVSSLLNHLRQIKTDLSGLTGNGHRQCSTPEYNPCSGALALTRRPLITFCPSFFTDSTDATRLETVLHEICHYAFFNANDRAYSSERVLPFLSTAEALDNAESIAIFILEMDMPSGARIESTMTTPTADTVTDCGPNEAKAKEALAWAQRWNTYAVFGVSQTYNNWVTFMFPYIVARLGTLNDRYVLAGIFDRYQSLDTEFSDTFTLECVDSANPACPTPVTLDSTADRTLLICPAFFSQNLHERIVTLYAEVTKLVPEIRDDQRRGYAELARDYKIHYWGLPPT